MTKNENKNVNKVNNVKENKGDIAMNNNITKVNTAGKDIFTKRLDTAMRIGGNSVKDIDDAIKYLKESGNYSTRQAVEALILVNDLTTNNVKVQRAKIYAGLSGNTKLQKELGCKNMLEIAEKLGFSDSKATISEMAKFYSMCYDNASPKLAEFIKVAKPTYTELVKIISVSNKKGLNTLEEKYKEIELFLNAYANNNVPQWGNTAQLRDFVDVFKKGVTVSSKTNKAGKADKTGKADNGNSDYKDIKSVAETTAKESNEKIKAMKASGDYIENKGKGTITITADGVADFMTKLVAIAKKQGVKPMSFTGEIVFTINGHK